MKKIDLTGKTFANLTVLREVGNNKHGGILWECSCSCGTSLIVCGDYLKSGNTKSCGCLKETQNGLSRIHPLYKAWRAMLRRCYEDSHHAYNRYGGRGISVCERWHDFLLFIEDVGERPEGMTLDRVDNDGNYDPNNCKWSNKSEQAKNRKKPPSRAKKYEYGDESLSIYEWADKCGIGHYTLRMRIKNDIPFMLAIQNLDLRTV